MNCRLVCKSFEKVLKNPIFWLRKCSKRGFSKNNYADWLRAIQISKNTIAEKNILLYLNLLVKRGTFIDVPCLINEETIKNYLALVEKNQTYSLFNYEFKCDPGLCQIVGPQNQKICIRKFLHIWYSVSDLSQKMVKVLAPLMPTPPRNELAFQEYKELLKMYDKCSVHVCKLDKLDEECQHFIK